jgi:hypothetical protein
MPNGIFAFSLHGLRWVGFVSLLEVGSNDLRVSVRSDDGTRKLDFALRD